MLVLQVRKSYFVELNKKLDERNVPDQQAKGCIRQKPLKIFSQFNQKNKCSLARASPRWITPIEIILSFSFEFYLIYMRSRR